MWIPAEGINFELLRHNCVESKAVYKFSFLKVDPVQLLTGTDFSTFSNDCRSRRVAPECCWNTGAVFHQIIARRRFFRCEAYKRSIALCKDVAKLVTPTRVTTKNEMMSDSSRDGGPTASTSQTDKLPSTVVPKCMRCDEKQQSIASEGRKKTLRWLLQSPEAAPGVAEEEEPESSRSPESGSSILKEKKRKRSIGFHYGSLKEDARPGPLCKPCFAKETTGKTVLYIAFWYLAYALLEAYKTSKFGERLTNFPAPRLLQAFFFLTQAAVSALFRLTKWGKKTSPIAGISWRSYILRVVPPGIANAIDINVAIPHPSIPDNCNNLSKSGAPFLVLLMTYSFHLETPTFKLTASITSFTIGTLLIVGKVLGQKIPLSRFALYTAASIVTSFRWTGTQILLQREILHMSTPFSTMRVMKPVAAIITLTISYFTESWGTLGEDGLLDTTLNIFLTTLVAAGGLALYTMKSVAELMLLARTSALTYIVLLLVKDVHHILEEMVHAGSSSFFERRGGSGGSLTQETIGFHYVAFGLGLFFWERYQQWSVRGLRRSVFGTMDEVQKENKLHTQ